MSHLYAGRLAAAYPGAAPERDVLVQMALHMTHRHPERLVSPSVERLAILTGHGTTRVRMALRTLEREGWITAVGSKKGGHKVTVAYRINLDLLDRFHDRSKLDNATLGVGLDEENPEPDAGFAANNPTPRVGLKRANPTESGRLTQRNRPNNPTPRVAEQGKYEQGKYEQGTGTGCRPMEGLLTVPPNLPSSAFRQKTPEAYPVGQLEPESQIPKPENRPPENRASDDERAKYLEWLKQQPPSRLSSDQERAWRTSAIRAAAYQRRKEAKQ